MEVTCEHCKAEYDFDESLVGESGTSVKCTDCGHVFKVYPAGSGAGRGRLQLRFRDGHIELLSSLRELQRRARDGEVTLDDEIGREGFEWRALRTVPELRGFFETGSVRPPGATTKPLGGGLTVTPSLRPDEPASAPAPRPSAAKQTMLGMGPGAAAARAPDGEAVTRVASHAAAPPPKPRQPAPQAPPSGSGPKPMAAAPRPPAAAQAPSPSQPGAKLFLAEDDEAEKPAARRSVGGGSLRWIGLGVLLAGGVWFAVSALGKGGLMGDSLGFAGGAVQGTPEPTPADSEAAAAPAVQAPPEPANGPTVESLENAPDDTETDKPQAEKPEKPAEHAKGKPETARAARTAHPKASEARKADEAPAAKHASERGSDGEDDDSKADYGTLVGRAGRALDRDDLAEAQSLYERALELRGSGSEANSGLGFTLLAQGKASAAIPHFRKAARNGFAVANVGLGDAYARMGLKAKAIEAYETYVSRLPNGNRAAYVRSQLDALGGSPSSSEADAPAPKGPAPKAPATTAPPEPSAPEPSAPEPPPTPSEEEPQPDEGDDYVPAGALL